MLNNKSFEIQNQVRHTALQAQENMKSLKQWELEMKQKEQETSKQHEQQQTSELNQKPPIRSKIEEFQKFHSEEESLQKIKSLSIDEDNKTSEELNDYAARKLEAIEFKDKGNKFVKAKEYESAIKMYTRAIELVDDDPVFFSNRSQCYLSLEKYKECIDDASRAIELDSKSSKSFYRRMVAYEKLGDDIKALKSCSQLLELTPEDQSSKNAYDRIHNRIVETEKKKDKEKIRWSRLSANAKPSHFVSKPPHLSSKRPMKKVPVRLRKAPSPIPEAILDKIFGNNTGERTPEPETDSKLFRPNFLMSSCDASPPKVAKIEETPQSEPKLEDEKKKLDETNEILKAAELKKELSIEELESQNSHLLSIPLTGPQFFATWKELGEIQRFLFLKNIANNNVPLGKLLGAQLDSVMLSEIINVVHKHFSVNHVPYIRLLSDLGKNSELSMLAMFFEENEKKKLNELLLESMASGDNETNNAVQDIKQNYQI